MHHHRLSLLWLSLVACFAGCKGAERAEPTVVAVFHVPARAETEASKGDPDDVAIWRDSSDPGKSLIVATDKSGGLQLYELDGTLRQDLRDGRMSNVDLRMAVEFGDAWGGRALIATNNQTSKTIDLYTIDPDTRMLVRLGATPNVTGKSYGLCMYRSPNDGGVYVFVNDISGAVAQYEAVPGPDGVPALALRRTLQFPGELEGCVADDELGRLYLGEETRGIWRVDAEPDGSDQASLLHDVDAPYLTADVEGLAIYHAANGKGYLLVSSQGSNTFAVFERGGDNAYLTSFRVAVGELDAAVETDGIEVTNLALGPMWPDGLFIAHDDHNEGFSKNFKLVRWGDVVAAANVELIVDVDHRVGR